MPMQMGFRWYGEGNDSISLAGDPAPEGRV